MEPQVFRWAGVSARAFGGSEFTQTEAGHMIETTSLDSELADDYVPFEQLPHILGILSDWDFDVDSVGNEITCDDGGCILSALLAPAFSISQSVASSTGSNLDRRQADMNTPTLQYQALAINFGGSDTFGGQLQDPLMGMQDMQQYSSHTDSGLDYFDVEQSEPNDDDLIVAWLDSITEQTAQFSTPVAPYDFADQQSYPSPSPPTLYSSQFLADPDDESWDGAGDFGDWAVQP